MIPGGARLKLEAKINLGNYESLGVQVEADCRTPEDVDELRAMLDAELAKFGRDDPEIGARVDTWRHRVLGGDPLAPVGVPGEPITVPGMEPVKVTKVSGSNAKKVPHVPSPAVAEPEPEPIEDPDPEPTDEEIAAMAPEPAKAPPATPAAKAKPTGTPSGVACVDCGAELSKKELTTSTLFVSQAVCTACLKARNKAAGEARV
jgi:predicted component of type VI protein secretion system